MDASGQTGSLIAGDRVDDAVAIARLQVEAGADVIVGRSRSRSRGRDGNAARDAIAATGLSLRIQVSVCDCMDGASLAAALRPWLDGDGDGDGDGDMEAFFDEEFLVTVAIAIARALMRYWIGRTDLLHEPRFVFLSNGSDYPASAAGRGDTRRAARCANCRPTCLTWSSAAISASRLFVMVVLAVTALAVVAAGASARGASAAGVEAGWLTSPGKDGNSLRRAWCDRQESNLRLSLRRAQ